MSQIHAYSAENEAMSISKVYWKLSNSVHMIGSTGSHPWLNEDEENPFFHTKKLLHSGKATGCIRDTNSIHRSNELIRKIVSFNRLFDEQFQKLATYFKDITLHEAKGKLNLSLLRLLLVNPDVISLELTSEKSIYYTLKKKNYTFFIQHFLEDLDEEDDEVIMTVFEDSIKLPSHAGTLGEVFFALNDILSMKKSQNTAFSLHELSY